MSEVIKVENLVKTYKKEKKNAVDGVSFSVDEGQFFAFLGPNGAGKSTTINILTTILSKTSGRVEVAGIDVDAHPDQVRDRIGIIFQNPSLDINLTAEENIRFHAVLYGLYGFRPTFKGMDKDYQDKVMQLAEILGIKDSINKRVKGFSGGMKRKLEILRSLIHNPQILFLDEPTTGLDPLSRRGLWEYLNQTRKQENTTIFLTTHYLEEAEGTDKLAIINNGRIATQGGPKKLKQELVQEYVHMDADNLSLLKQELQSKNVKFEEAEEGVTVPLEGDGKHAQELIKKIETELNFLQIHLPTLEDAYLEIINRPTDEEPHVQEPE